MYKKQIYLKQHLKQSTYAIKYSIFTEIIYYAIRLSVLNIN